MPYGQTIALILFELGFGLKFNLVGSISISELFLMLYVPLSVLPKVRWREAAGLRHITVAYAVLLLAQAVSEAIVGNSVASSLKGMAVTVVSYLHFMFLVFFLSRRKALIIVLLLAQAARTALFSNIEEDMTMEDFVAGEGAVYLKFYGGTILAGTFLAVSIVLRNKYFPLAFAAIGMALIALGARSGGATALLSGLVAYLFAHPAMTLSKKALAASGIAVCIVAYASYAYYVSQVLSGNITSGNSWQIFLCKNPYNPLELLLVGRSEAWVGWQAFTDKFWLGHGAWAYDTTGRYWRMMLTFHEEMQASVHRRLNTGFLVPSHSVLIGSGVANGVMAMAAMAAIVGYFLRKGAMGLKGCSPSFRLVLAYQLLDTLWTVMFSPLSHFRLTMPIAFAIIFVLCGQGESRAKAPSATEAGNGATHGGPANQQQHTPWT